MSSEHAIPTIVFGCPSAADVVALARLPNVEVVLPEEGAAGRVAAATRAARVSASGSSPPSRAAEGGAIGTGGAPGLEHDFVIETAGAAARPAHDPRDILGRLTGERRAEQLLRRVAQVAASAGGPAPAPAPPGWAGGGGAPAPPHAPPVYAAPVESGPTAAGPAARPASGGVGAPRAGGAVSSVAATGDDDVLPVFGAALAELQALIGNPHTGTEEVERLAVKDPGLLMALLSASNAAYYRSARPITTVREAVVRLVVRQALAVLLERVLREGFRASDPDTTAILVAMWNNAALTARLARRLAEWYGVCSADDAHLAGLLHDFGEMTIVWRAAANETGPR
jgi:hypothetical protein